MLKSRVCPICKNKSFAELRSYSTGYFDRSTGEEIVVPNVEIYQCSDEGCGHRWLPSDQERKIDKITAERSRYDLVSDEIRTIRESFPFDNKFQVANFLCLNEKAFTRWELGYSEPNRAYDLLLRLSAHSVDNFNFVKHLHETNFKFDASDYELVCEKKNLNWKFSQSKVKHFNRGIALSVAYPAAYPSLENSSEQAVKQPNYLSFKQFSFTIPGKLEPSYETAQADSDESAIAS